MLKCSNYQGISIGEGICSLLGTKIKVFFYIVDGLLIDTGPSVLAKESRVFFKNNHIEQVALTHVHEDHTGMAGWLQKNMGIPIYLHKDVISDALQEGSYPLYRHFMWGKRPAFQPEAVPEQLSTSKHILTVIDAPGHTAAHNIYHEKEEGWLFTGDLYLGTRQIVAFYEEDISQTIATIKMILELDFDTVFCAHSGVWQDGKKLFQQKLDYLEDLQWKVNNLKNQGLNSRQIDARLFPARLPITYVSRGEWSSNNIIRTL